MKKCAVIGSINMDIVIGVPRFPVPGETLTGRNFQTIPGGKGANQAIALGRLGTPVCMAGCLGRDAFGNRYMDHFGQNGVDVGAVSAIEGTPTGIADILVHEDGENFIVIVPGANEKCDSVWLDGALEKVNRCDIFLLQLEIPLETVIECIRRLRAMGKTIILDPAPAVSLPDDVLEMVDILTPNETELRIITPGMPESASPEERIAHLIGGSDRMVIHKRGGSGAYIGTKDGIVHVPGFKVKVVDTTAAGDTFNAGLATGLARGMGVEASVRFANAAAALSVTAFGAQDGMPTLQQVEQLIGAVE